MEIRTEKGADGELGHAIVLHLQENSDEAIVFAAAELGRCLAAMTGREVVHAGAAEAAAGMLPGIAIRMQGDGGTAAAAEQPDGIAIDVDGGSGVISGTNPRSVLMAVYRYLHTLGCRWVRPGRTGEHLPRIVWPAVAVAIQEEASYRHRGICLEGAVSIEHVLEMIDWMPKLGLNSYFIQFREAFTFFERWYKKIEVADTLAFMEQAVAEIRKRGLLYHSVGHGWTCNALGLPGLGWEQVEWQGEADAELAAMIAEVGGERKLWKSVPLDTELCYSNARARQRFVDEAAAYASAHPEIDYLHVWLSDGMNNQCECLACRATTPSDWYVLLLNELDARLSELGIATRIVFLIYQELLWRPLQEQFAHSARFLLMFAPITRTYRQSFADAGELPELPPFVRNQIELPRTIADNIAFLAQWQDRFTGDSFDFDYHLMWAQQRDPGHMKLAQILHADIQALASLGLNGYMSCQVQRNCFPSGFAMTVMGSTLWNRTASFDALAEDYYAHAYGKDGVYCRNYLETLSRLYDQINLEGGLGKPLANLERYASVTAELEQFKPIIGRNLASLSAVQARSWRHLEHHRQLWLAMTDILRHYDAGDRQQGYDSWQRLQDWLWEIEPQVADVFDVQNFILVMGWILDGPGQETTNNEEAISCEA
jgi:hypothetical protein